MMTINNVSYDLLTVLQNKLEGLAAYDKYIQDSQSDQQVRQIFEQLKQQDQQQVQNLRAQIERLVKDGKF